ncbi:aminodeoxychorismate synthase component I [Corynebacterium canis]|uniref:aminodeoxychorismate synthase n=1 Tax=Corynebacterium canis TaxID=679663 RepID=A0A5C5UKG6_9CORY|nr:chorismate-binding protein [Corynebacterium canis]TWT26724.1 aminodeoxychorismate synthase component I [Corynebacterium canis]WJY74596.1 Aminodeoxychorismate synthase component 1 [Corynebacterium canis]
MTSILLIDNHDSFTHLLGDLVWRAVGIRPRILANNSPELDAAAIAHADLVIVSPGPGHPAVSEDLGGSALAIAQTETPVIGVCLGHQAIALAAGANVARAHKPMHGLTSQVVHNGTGIFADIPSPMEVVRYHSLDVSLPTPQLEVLARADDGTIMALRRTDAPQWGVQFHPESIGTFHGLRLMRNLIEATGCLSGIQTWHRRLIEPLDFPALARHWSKEFPHLVWLDSEFTLMAAGSQTVHLAQIPPGRLSSDSCPAKVDFIPGALGAITYEATGGWDGASIDQIADNERFILPDVVVQRDQQGTYLITRVDDPYELPALTPEYRVPPAPSHSPVVLTDTKHEYIDKVRRCQEFIRRGESYELCLTTSATTHVTVPPLDLYLRLRSTCPAPMSGLVLHPDVAVLSASPERFLSVKGGVVTASPIKGTRPRGANDSQDVRNAEELAGSLKDRAENMMIVDLLRNDLARTCVPGSLDVPELCVVHSFAWVHQLVSTITGVLPPGVPGVRAAMAAFPGGSMTGAPKQRSMDILADIEGQPRGYYSGSMGYVSANGDCDFSILIRTAVHIDGKLTYGAGGAVTLLSDPEEEYNEVLVKMLPLRLLLGEEK